MKNSNIKNIDILPDNLHSIIIGLILGDGHIYKSSPTSNSRFEISFGKDRELFANWVNNLFSNYSNTGVKKTKFKNTLNNLNYNFRFKTKSLPIFNYYHSIFYEINNVTQKYKKIIPHNIIDFMNPIVLAYLIMTDGNFDKSRNRIRIYTNSYTKLEVKKLAKVINIKLNIYVGVLHDRNNQWILTIGAKQLNLVRKLVIPYFEPSLLYRIGLNK